MTQEERKQLAIDIFKGLVFISNGLDSQQLVSSFMPLALMNNVQLAEMQASNPALIYEYLDKASSMGINGKPMFSSMKYIGEEDYNAIREMYKQLEVVEQKLGVA